MSSSETSGDPENRLDRGALETERSLLADVFKRSPSFMAVLRGPQHVFELANDRYYELIGHRQVLGQSVHDALPEIAGQGFFELLDGVYATGEPFVGRDMRVMVQRTPGHALEERHIEFVYQALRAADGAVNGVFVHGIDLTEHKRAETEVLASEQRYRGLFESIDQGLCVVQVIFDADSRAHDYRFLETNTMFEQHTGLKNAVGRTARELVPSLEERWFEMYGRVATTGEPMRFVQASDPMGRWFDVYAFRTGPVQDRKVAILFKDVTQGKRAEAAQRQSEERLRLALAIAGMGTFDIDLLTDDVIVNEAGRAIYGWPDQEPLTFAKVQGHFHPDDRAMVMESVAAAMDPNGPGEFAVEQRIVRTDGAVRWIRVRGRVTFASPKGAGHLRPIRCIGTYLDVTDQKEAEHQREQLLSAERGARFEAERAGRMKDEFLATLSHELRTPLNAILGWSSLLSNRPGVRDDDDLRAGLETIERNARAQAQIIEDLLDMSSIISGKVRLDVQRVDLAVLLQHGIETVRPAAEVKNVTLSAVLDPSVGPVSGDPNRLQQVFWNLLNNAVKFTSRGGRVQVALEHASSHVEVSVVDTGQGISAQFLPHVFDRFRQADASTTRQHGGLGLGLSIVKQLVELHGGSVRAKSDGVGLGATIVVALPLASVQSDPSPKPALEHPAVSLHTEMHRQACLQLEGVRVLVVDDEADGRTVVRRLLEECGAIVRTASSAGEAFDFYRSEAPDVLVSDIGMPKEDGYSLIRRIRALDPTQGGKVPAVALTAYARPEDRIRAVQAGFQMHVVKPVEPAELITMVASLVGRVGS
ncbi:MAG TPA: ATP-binding protein [Tepidisphaeraceae bacterium]|jgi:PAS domain S-box-containing protein|nr:ATP-binding protein [Tepidisphaeraceae bacterium]